MRALGLTFGLCLLFNSLMAQRSIRLVLVDSLNRSLISGAVAFDNSGQELGASDNYGVIIIDSVDFKNSYVLKHSAYRDYQLSFGDESIQNRLELLLVPLTRELEEVVVNNGYQFIPKERATGSFSTINNAQLQERISHDILDRLEGMAPGVQFDRRNGTTTLNIRGINSLSSGLIAPLIVVDNFPYEGDLSAINPNDVESVALLKDAAATSIWGARAGNGVIVINLKKPKESQRINFESNLTITDKPDLKYYQAMSSQDFIELERELYGRGFYNSLLANRNARLFVFSPVVSTLHDLDKGIIVKEEAEAKIRSYQDRDYRDDLHKYFYRIGMVQQYTLSTSIVEDRYGFRTSLSYDDHVDVEKHSNRERMNLLSTAYFRPFKNLRLELTTSFVNRKNESSLGFPNYPINPGGNKTQLFPYAELVSATGQPLNIPYKYNLNYVDTVSQGRLLDWHYAPLDDINRSRSVGADRYLTLSPTVQITPVDGVTFSVLYNYENRSFQSDNHYTTSSFYTRDLLNRYTTINADKVTYNIPLGDVIQFSNNHDVGHKGRLQGNLDKNWNDHHVVALVGSEVSSRRTTSRIMREYGYDPDRLTTQPVNYTTLFPIYDGLARNTAIPYSNGVGELLSRYVSLYANASYSYTNKYVLTVSARRDASNVFGVRANKLWNPLWSVGGAWNISKENWFPNQNFLNDVKLRVTTGHSGNSGRLANTDVIISFQSADQYYGKPYARITRPPNPDLKWEDVAMTNIGVDMAFFNNKLNANIDLFAKKSTDLISEDPINPTVGFSTVNRNVAEINGKGIDFRLEFSQRWSNWKWNSSLFLSYTKDKVSKFNGQRFSSITYASRGGTSISPLVGYVLYPVFSYRFAGLDPENGNPRGYLAGEVSDNYTQIFRDSLEHLTYHGSALPLGHGAFSNSISYKSLALSLTLSFKFSSYFLKPTVNYYNLYNNWETHRDYEKRWQKPGDEKFTTVPSAPYPANQSRDNFYIYSDPNVEKGDLIRLQNIKLQYSLAQKTSKFLGLESARMFVSANNLGLLWTASSAGYDPDYTYLPPAGNFNVGLNLIF